MPTGSTPAFALALQRARHFTAFGRRAVPTQMAAMSPAARAPLLWAALAFALGLLIGKYAWHPPLWWLIAACFFILAAAYFVRRRTWISCILVLGAFTFAGALTIQTNSAARANLGPVWLGDGNPVVVTGNVVTEGTLQSDGARGLRQQVDVESETIQADESARPVSTGIRLNIYSKAGVDSEDEKLPEISDEPRSRSMRLFHYGERIRFSAVLNPPHNFQNPGAFDYAGYLRDQGIFATASVKSGEIESLPGFSGSRISSYLARARHSIITRIHALWPEQSAALVDAMLIGERSFIDRPTRVDFQRSGTYHMLIVAGLHVGILAMFAMWLLGRLGCSDFAASALTMAVIVIYAALTRENSPVWRAALMLCVYVITRFLYRKRAVLNALGVAGLALLVLNPNVLLGASFQMSFLCVVLIAGIAVPFIERTIEPFVRGLRNLDALAYDRSLPPGVAEFRLDIRLILNRAGMIVGGAWPRRLIVLCLQTTFRFAELTLVSAVMQLGMALPMAYYFHRATSVSTLANLLAVPLLQLLMPMAAGAIGISYVSVWLARIPAKLAAAALAGITGTVSWLGSLHIADMRLPTPGLAVLTVSGLAIVLSVLFFRKRTRFSLVGIGVLASGAFGVWNIPPHQQIRPGILELTAIDVGQGDSLLLVLPDGRKLLVDAGGLPFWTLSQMDIGEDVVSPYLWSRGISHLDAVALTHAHADHMGGFPAVIANFHPRELWLPVGVPDQEISDLLSRAERSNLKIIYRKTGDTFVFGGAQIRVLAPDPEFPIRVAHRNDESLVMKISLGKTSTLLEADAERGTERLVASEQPGADVLKVAHHGSLTSSEPELLAAVHPKFAVISVGVRNVYHHPRLEVLSRLQQANVITYRTDTDGATTLFLDGSKVTAHSFSLH